MRIFLLIILCSWLITAKTQVNKVIDSFDIYYNDCDFPIPAKFPGGFKAWSKYLRTNINSNLGNKYILIPKGKSSAKSTVVVSFVISKWGYVKNVERAPNDTIKVHPKLVAEAIRVIKASPKWVAARSNSKRVAYRNIQSITWQIDVE